MSSVITGLLATANLIATTYSYQNENYLIAALNLGAAICLFIEQAKSK